MQTHILEGGVSQYFKWSGRKYNDRVVLIYDSIEELLSVDQIVTPTSVNAAGRAAATLPSWGPTGTTTSEIRRLLREGWSIGGQVVAAIADHIRESAPQPKDLRRKLGWSDHGDEIDMNRVYRGDLDRAWKRARRKYTVTQQQFRIAFHWCDFGSRWQRMIYNGATAIALADLLERYGYRCEIIGVHTGGVNMTPGSKLKGWQAVSILPVKGYDEPVRVDTLAAIAHPATFKNLGIMGYHGLDRKCHHGGECDDAASQVCTMLTAQGLLERCDVVFDYCADAAGCLMEVHKALRQLNGEHFLLSEDELTVAEQDIDITADGLHQALGALYAASGETYF